MSKFNFRNFKNSKAMRIVFAAPKEETREENEEIDYEATVSLIILFIYVGQAKSIDVWFEWTSAFGEENDYFCHRIIGEQCSHEYNLGILLFH